MQTKDLIFTVTFLVLSLFAGSQVLSAQVSNERMTHSRGDNDALILELPSADEKMVSKLWPDWVKENFEVKTKNVKKAKGEMQSLNFKMPGVAPGGKVDMYSMVKKTGKEGSELTIWIATSEGYVSPELDRTAYFEAEKALMRFALAVSRAQIEEDIEGEQDVLGDLEKELERLRKQKDDYEKDIRNAEKAIEEARAKIDRNLIDQENKAKEIERQLDQIEVVKQKLKEY